MSYFGGDSKGYEAGILSIGMAYTKESPTKAHEFERLDKPVLTPKDAEVSWWENSTMYKNTVIRDKEKVTGHNFIMYYNARGDSLKPAKGAERQTTRPSATGATGWQLATSCQIRLGAGCPGNREEP